MSWFKAEANDNGTADIWINKAIGSDWAPDWVNDLFGETSARQFIDAVEALGDLTEITVRLNSPGGDVASGIAMMNYLRNHKATIHMRVEGMAASIASVLLMAGDTRSMGIGATVMVHDPMGWMGGYYTEAELRERADQMAVIKQACVEAYVAGTGKSEAEIAELMGKGDTYMTADEAMEWGFATDKDDTLQAVACADPNTFRQQLETTGQLRAAEQQVAAQAQQIETLTSQLATLQPGKLDAQAVIDRCTAEQLDGIALNLVKAGVTAGQLEQQLALAKGVNDICAAASLEAAPILAELGDASAMMRVAVTNAMAAADQDTDTHYQPGQSTAKAPDSVAIYAQLNNPTGNTT